MKKLILLVICLCLSVIGFSSGSIVHAETKPYEAQDACGIAGFDDPLICGTGESNEEKELQKRVKSMLETVYMWIGIIAVIVIVIGGIRYMTSTGEAEKIKGAKNTIMYAIIGLVVTLAAFAITEFAIGALDGRDLVDGPAPSTGTTAEPSEIKQLRVTPKATLVEGDALQLKVLFIPDYAADRTITFRSDNPEVASVNQTGAISAKKAGTTTIITKAKNGVEARTDVTVIKPIPVEKVELDPTKVEVKVGATKTIKAKISPKNAADKSLKWTSSDTKIATVDNRGTVRGVKDGEATITATAHNGIKATATVNVGDKMTGGDAIAHVAVNIAYTVGPQQSRKMIAWPSTKLTDSKAQTFIRVRDSKEVGIGDHNVGDEHGHLYASCDLGVAVAVRYAGVDKNFEFNGTPNIERYLAGSGKSKWTLVGTFERSSSISSISKLQPGDVLLGEIPHGHIFIYTGNKAVRKKYPNSNADSYEAGYGSVENASYYPHLFNLVEDSKKRTINNMTYKVFRSVDWDKKKFEKKKF